jgi:hypothetical protein
MPHEVTDNIFTPDERLGFGSVGCHEVFNRFAQLIDVAKRRSPQRFAAQNTKPDFNLKISTWADETDPPKASGEDAEVKYEKVIEKREMDWLKKSKIE